MVNKELQEKHNKLEWGGMLLQRSEGEEHVNSIVVNDAILTKENAERMVEEHNKNLK